MWYFLQEPPMRNLSSSSLRCAITSFTHWPCEGGSLSFHLRRMHLRAKRNAKAMACDWLFEIGISSGITLKMAVNRSGVMAWPHIWETVSKTEDQKGAIDRHEKKIWDKVAGALRHLSQVGSVSGYILASLLLQRCRRCRTLNWSSPCLTQREDFMHPLNGFLPHVIWNDQL